MTRRSQVPFDAACVPAVMAADMAKGLLVNGGSQPAWQKGWILADYLENGIERSGFYGAVQVGSDHSRGGE